MGGMHVGPGHPFFDGEPAAHASWRRTLPSGWQAGGMRVLPLGTREAPRRTNHSAAVRAVRGVHMLQDK